MVLYRDTASQPVQARVPDDHRHTHDHEWLRPTGSRWRIGVTQFVTGQAGDIMKVELTTPGTVIGRGDQFGAVESVMVAQPLHAPVSGKVVAVNEQLRDAPELVNAEPYGGGWMIEVEPGDRSQADELLTSDDHGKGFTRME